MNAPGASDSAREDDLTESELSAIFEWAESSNHIVATAYWALIGVFAAIEECGLALDTEMAEILEADCDPSDSEEWCDAVGALEAFEEAFYKAREVLARRCLSVMPWQAGPAG